MSSKVALITGITGQIVRCETCGTILARKKGESYAYFLKRKFCNKKCYWDNHRGKNHHNYKGGLRRGHDGGYIRFSNGEYVHRWVVEAYTCRELERWEHVHHIDGDPTNNDIENLMIVTNSQHRVIEARDQARGSNGRFV